MRRRPPARAARPGELAPFDVRAFLEQIPPVTYAVPLDAPNAVCLHISPQVETMLGYAPEEWTSRPGLWRDLVHPSDRDRVIAALERGERTGQPLDEEYRLFARDGRVVWVHDQASIVTDEDGRAAGWQGVISDVTAAKVAEQALRESEEHYRALVERVPAVVYIVSNDRTPRTLYVSPQIEQVVGLKPERFAADPNLWPSIVHPEDRARFLDRWASVVESGAPFEAEYRVIAPDGRLIWVRDRCVLMRDEHGAPLGWQGVTDDITTEKEVTQQLQAAAAKYRALVENIPAIVYEVAPDGDGTTLYVSAQVERVLGYPREEWLEQPDIWMELLHPDDREPTLAAYDLHNETGEPWSRQYRLIASDGRAVWFRDEATLVRSADGWPLAWQGVRLDITAQKEAEEALRRAHDDLEQRVSERTQELEDANELMMLEVLERRHAEAALREAEERFRLLVERIPAVVYIWEILPISDEPHYYTSPQIEALTGFTPAEWDASRGFPLSRVHPDDRRRVLEATFHSETTGQPFRVEYRLLAKDGRVIWVRDEATILRRTREGRPWLFQGVLIDITEQKESERRWRNAEARALTMVEQLPAITYLWDRGHRSGFGSRSYVSPQLESILGYEPEEWLSHPDAWRRCVHPDDRARLDRARYADGDTWSTEYRVVAKDGRVVWIRDCGRRLLRDDEGLPPLLSGVMLDVTAERESHERLRRSEDHYRALVEGIPAIAFVEVVDGGDPRDRRIVFVSPQVEAILGYEPDEVVAAAGALQRMIHPPADALGAADAGSSEADRDHAEYRVRARDGREVWLESRATLVRDEEGRPRLWHGIALDVTARKRAEEELRAIEARFQDLVRSAGFDADR